MPEGRRVSIQYCTYAYDDEKQAREDFERLQARKVTGEFALRRHEGRWFLEIGAEKDLPDAFLGKLTGERL